MKDRSCRLATRLAVIVSALVALAGAGCNDADTDPDLTPQRGEPGAAGKGDTLGSCVGYCGQQTPTGCWCDEGCAGFGDCCTNKVSVCDGGCAADADCSAGEYCALPVGACTPSGPVGVCATKPQICPEIYAPVCGCDGQTYSSKCHAAGAGATIAALGECPLPGGCQADSDCSSDKWCRCADASCNAKECVDFAGEGSNCAGFTMPHFVQRCDPALTCWGRQTVVDAPGTCVAAVATVAQVLADPAQYVGHVVGIEANIRAGLAACTRLACPPTNPCCNSCGAGQFLVDGPSGVAPISGLSLRNTDGSAFACSGNECNYQENCTQESGKYRVWGTIQHDANGTSIVVSKLEKQFL